jgi:hypothetical protein
MSVAVRRGAARSSSSSRSSCERRPSCCALRAFVAWLRRAAHRRTCRNLRSPAMEGGDERVGVRRALSRRVEAKFGRK